MLEALRSLIGSPPAGLEFIEYFVLVGFVVASIYFVYKIISIIFNNIDTQNSSLNCSTISYSHLKK